MVYPVVLGDQYLLVNQGVHWFQGLPVNMIEVAVNIQYWFVHTSILIEIRHSFSCFRTNYIRDLSGICVKSSFTTSRNSSKLNHLWMCLRQVIAAHFMANFISSRSCVISSNTPYKFYRNIHSLNCTRKTRISSRSIQFNTVQWSIIEWNTTWNSRVRTWIFLQLSIFILYL